MMQLQWTCDHEFILRMEGYDGKLNCNEISYYILQKTWPGSRWGTSKSGIAVSAKSSAEATRRDSIPPDCFAPRCSHVWLAGYQYICSFSFHLATLQGIKIKLLYSWRFSAYSVPTHWSRHLKMKLFPAKCHEQATSQKLWPQTVNSSLLPAKC